MLPEGRFAWRAESEESYPLELVVESAPLGAGQHRLEVQMAGKLRLWVGFEFDGLVGSITGYGTPGPHSTEGETP